MFLRNINSYIKMSQVLGLSYYNVAKEPMCICICIDIHAISCQIEVYRKPCMYLTLRLPQSFHLNSWQCFTFENHFQAVEDSIDPFVWFRYLSEIQWNWRCLDASQFWMSCRYISICWMHFWLKSKFQMSMQEKLRFITAFILILKLLSDTTLPNIF